MELIYDSDSYCVMRVAMMPAGSADASSTPGGHAPRLGYEIVDKIGRREIYLDGPMAERFAEQVQQLIAQTPQLEGEERIDQIDAFLARLAPLMQQPVALH